MKTTKYMLTALFLFAGMAFSVAQTKEAADNYTQVITQRSAKILTNIGITDSVKFKKVRDVLVDQYRSLGTIHDTRNAKAKEIKDQPAIEKAVANAKIAALDSTVDRQLKTQHKVFLSKLEKDLSAEQIVKVKDEMTYKILPLTYGAYLDEIPTLTEPQKAQLMAWLVEARELAIDAESSEKKHAVFGKYKGRINNYLSAQGYDMKKEGEEWQKRIKAKAGN